MKVVIDTNVILDVLDNRAPFVDDSSAVLEAAARGTVTGALTANTITDIAYLLHKYLEREGIKAALLGLMELLDVLEVNYEHCVEAFDLSLGDYEDAVLAHCAKGWGADYIVTRNLKDFTSSPVAALTPGDFIRVISCPSEPGALI